MIAESSVPLADPTYTVTDLGTRGGDISYGNAINDLGHVLGTSKVPEDTGNPFDQHSFLWRDGRMHDLGRMLGQGLNNRDQIAGSLFPSGPFDPELYLSSRPILWQNGQSRDLLPPGATSGQAVAINDDGLVVGQTVTMPNADETQNVEIRIFLWQDGQVSYLPVPSEYIAGVPRAINNQGQVVGQVQTRPADGSLPLSVAALWDGQGVTALALPPGFRRTNAVAINTRGHILIRGDFPRTDAPPSRQNPNAPVLTRAGLLWDAGQVTPISPEAPGVIPRALNDHSQVVGQINHKIEERFAFHWANGKMTDLNTRIPADSGWRLTDATAINNHGQIAGTGTHARKTRAYLLTPTNAGP